MTGSDGSRRSTAVLAGLSARELDVLTLMSEGLTNDAIAKRAFLSVKTVESVVRSVFRKLGLIDNPEENRRVVAVRMLLEATPSASDRWPHYMSEFVGRSNELSELTGLIADAPLVTIVGPGGIGKTRAAVELAERAERGERVAASVHFVDLCGVTPGGGVAALLDACGIAFTTDLAAWRQLGRFVRSAPRLIVIDNAETSLAETRSLVARLVACGASSVVVTSREPLALPGERVFSLAPLDDDAAARLLLDRIGDAGVDVGGVDAATLASITRNLAGMPLAIELVAMHFISADEREVAARLTALPELLSRPGRDRHASLGAALDSSYTALSDDAQDLFRRLSVLRGGFTLDSLRRAAGSAWIDIDNAVDELVRSSLVGFGRGRYRILEPVRQYAGSLASELGEQEVLDDLLRRYAVELALHVRTIISGPPERILARLRSDWDNLTAALDGALASGDVSSALRICGSLALWAARRPVSGIAVVERVLTELDGSEPANDRAWGLLCLGCLSSLTGDDARAREALDAAVELFEATGDRTGLLEALYWSAHTSSSADTIDRVIALAAEMPSPYIEGWARLLQASSVLYAAPLSAQADRSAVTDRVVELANRADAIASRFDFRQLKSGVLEITVQVRLVNALSTGAWAGTDDLWSLIDEIEQISRTIDAPHNVTEAMIDRSILRVHHDQYADMRDSLVEHLELSAVGENVRHVISSVLLAASLLEHEHRFDHARKLVAAAAPTFCSYLDPSWLVMCVPSPDLYKFAVSHADGALIPATDIDTIVEQCRAMLAELG